MAQPSLTGLRPFLITTQHYGLGYIQPSRQGRDWQCSSGWLSFLYLVLSAAPWGAGVRPCWWRNFHTPYKIPAATKPR
jgi:hypothetical protein